VLRQEERESEVGVAGAFFLLAVCSRPRRMKRCRAFLACALLVAFADLPVGGAVASHEDIPIFALENRHRPRDHPQDADAKGLRGTYKGSETVLGEIVDMQVKITSHTTMNFLLKGAFAIHCKNESYTLQPDGSITLPGAGNKSDCLTKELEADDILVESVCYDSIRDVLTIKVTVLYFLDLTFQLSHEPSLLLDADKLQSPTWTQTVT
jgi:hypothetical protein